MMFKPKKVAIVGASGLVGQQFIKILDEFSFPIEKLSLFASAKSAGKSVLFQGNEIIIQECTETSFEEGFDVILFSAGGDVSRKFAPIASKTNALVIDNSSAWRMDELVPLVVPECNPQDIFFHQGIIANPNCSTIQAVVALQAVEDLFDVTRISFSTYQAVSGSGYKGINDLHRGEEGAEPLFYPHPIIHNVIPQIDRFLDTFETYEELKMRQETKKILHKPQLIIHSTCIRVPVLNSHTVVVHAQCKNVIDQEQLIQAWKNNPAIEYIAAPDYPTPLRASGQDKVLIGRLVCDKDDPTFVSFITVADNIRKGAATNAVQIAMTYFKEELQ
jgi:aspartate-semialdehyde dehydrogenase